MTVHNERGLSQSQIQSKLRKQNTEVLLISTEHFIVSLIVLVIANSALSKLIASCHSGIFSEYDYDKLSIHYLPSTKQQTELQ